MRSEPIVVRGVKLVELQEIVGENGTVIVGEVPDMLPFTAKRVFTLHNVPSSEARGTHAHRKCEQFLMCVSGSVIALVDDGSRRQEVLLDRPSLGLYMPALTWGTQHNYSSDAVLVVLASDPYDADDYIHDYSEFQRLSAEFTSGT